MKEYYVHATKAASDACNAEINSFPQFPITSKVNGCDCADMQKTTNWAAEGRQMLTGEWATPRIPCCLLDALEIPEENRDAFLTAYGQDIRELDSVTDFPAYDGGI